MPSVSAEHSLTFRELQTRVAERLGIADYSGTVAAPPSDTNDADLVKRLLQDAVRQFVRAVYPGTGRAVQWSWTAPIVSVSLTTDGTGSANIAGDATRYRLPEGVCSAPKGRVSWSDGSTGGHVVDTSVDLVIRKQAERPSEVGPPLYCAVFQSTDPGNSPNQRPPMEMRVFPTPSRAITLTTRLKIEPTKMVNDADRGNWPASHDLTIVDMAVAAHAPSDINRARATESLIASIAFDEDSKPRHAGSLGDSSDARTSSLTPSFITTDGTVV
jgi:hypothetical protein